MKGREYGGVGGVSEWQKGRHIKGGVCMYREKGV